MRSLVMAAGPGTAQDRPCHDGAMLLHVDPDPTSSAEQPCCDGSMPLNAATVDGTSCVSGADQLYTSRWCPPQRHLVVITLLASLGCAALFLVAWPWVQHGSAVPRSATRED